MSEKDVLIYGRDLQATTDLNVGAMALTRLSLLGYGFVNDWIPVVYGF